MREQYVKLIHQAQEYYKNGDLVLSTKTYESAFEIGSLKEDVLALGFIYLELENQARARDLFQKVLELEEDEDAYFGLAAVSEQSGLLNDAIKYYELALSLSPENYEYLFNCAYVYDQLDNIEMATKYYNKVLQLNDENFWAHLNLGSILESEDLDEEALKHFQKAYDIDSTSPMVAYNLGVIYTKLNNPEKALKYYLEELTKENFYKLTYYNLGLLYKDSFHDYQNAKLMYLKSIKEDSTNYNTWYNLGCLYALMDDYDNAYDCFKYIFYHRKKLLQYIKEDNELSKFRQSTHYQRLMNL